jgi:hypothetical protein
MARRGSSARGAAKKAPTPRRNWRQTFASQDASAIWHHLFDIVSGVVATARAAEVTQDLFLELLASGRLELYAAGRWLDDDIDRDIRRMLSTA